MTIFRTYTTLGELVEALQRVSTTYPPETPVVCRSFMGGTQLALRPVDIRIVSEKRFLDDKQTKLASIESTYPMARDERGDSAAGRIVPALQFLMTFEQESDNVLV